MSDRQIQFGGLYSAQILEVLAEFLGSSHALENKILEFRLSWLAEGWIHEYGTKHAFLSPDFFLTLPDPVARKRTKPDSGDLDELARLWRSHQGTVAPAPISMSIPGRLDEHLERLGLLLPGDDGKSDLAVASETRRLVVGRGVDEQSFQDMFSQLKTWNPAPPRVAFAQEGIEGRDIYIFDVNDDKARQSSLESALVGSEFISLEGYEVELMGKTCWAFLPTGRKTPRTALSWFAFVWWQLLGWTLRSTAHEDESRIPNADVFLFAWLTGVPAAIVRLDHLHFVARIRLAPILEEAPREFLTPRQIFDSTNDDHVKALRDRLSSTIPPQGYRLSLQRYERGATSAERRQELEAEINRCQTELVFIENSEFQLRCDILHRFSHRQLAALVETLVSYSPEQLGRIKYAFYEFNDRFPEGVHFLLVDPGIDFHRLAPALPFDEEYADTAFQLDPFWAQYYAKDPNASRVYVPKGYTLYPALHSPKINDMDSYLKEVFGGPYHGLFGTQKLPDDPLYVFDDYGKHGKDLALCVLSLGDFRPINTPGVVSFLSDLLLVIFRLGGASEFIRVMSEQELRGQALKETTEQLKKAESDFAASRDALRQRIESESASLVRDLNGALQDLIKRTAEFANEAALLNRRLSELKSLEQEVQGMVARSDRAYSDVKKAGSALDDATVGLRKTIETSVQDAERALGEAEGHYDRLEKLVQSKVAELTDRHAKLDAEFSKLRRVS